MANRAHKTDSHRKLDLSFGHTTGHQKDQNEQGAVLVMGLFMGIFLVAILYHVIGVGQSAVENELGQSAADSMTYSAAAVKARGMNTIALINLIMATVLAVLVAVRLVEMLLVVAMAVVGVACVVSGGAACGAVVPLAKAEHELHEFSENIEDTVHQILHSLEEVAEVVNHSVPILAEAEAVYISQKEGRPVSRIGAVWPIVDELPTEKGTFEELCEQAGKQVIQVSTFFLPGNLPEKANETIGELLGTMASKFSRYFCGGGDPPRNSHRHEVAYPTKDHTECDNADVMSMLDENTCTTQLCIDCVRAACETCSIRLGDSKFKQAKWKYEQREWIEKINTSGRTQIVQQWPTTSHTEWTAQNPCDNPLECGRPILCETEERETGTRWGADTIKVTQRRYRQLISCIVEEETELVTPNKVDGKDWPKPRVLKNDATRDDFRVWGLALGRNNSSERLDFVGKLYMEKTDDLPNARIHAASAEFLSSTNDLWHLHWYSRLIRFRMPSNNIFSVSGHSQDRQAHQNILQHLGELRKFSDSLMVH
ncbi:MAG: hypothetical protein JXX29_19390 [Deltaproteobacteria bacterium]|nr:hypothetical protein [Deltaproteobacteria bacterium]MBN2673853.1 hypothetical protein [Deltaproteobacteria bacterium]